MLVPEHSKITKKMFICLTEHGFTLLRRHKSDRKQTKKSNLIRILESTTLTKYSFNPIVIIFSIAWYV